MSALYPILLKYHYFISIILFIFCLCLILLHCYLAASAVSLYVHQKLSLKYNSWIGAVSLWLTCHSSSAQCSYHLEEDLVEFWSSVFRDLRALKLQKVVISLWS